MIYIYIYTYVYIYIYIYKYIYIYIYLYINIIENRITFEINTGYYLKFVTPEKMKVLGSTKSKIAKDENGENLPPLEITQVVLFHCTIVSNNYHQNSKVLWTFISNKSFDQLLDISPKSFIFLKKLIQNF